MEPGELAVRPMRILLNKTLADADATAMLRSHADAIVELQTLPAARIDIIRNVTLNGASTALGVPIPHRLGRAPVFVGVSVPRVAAADLASLTAGMIVDTGTATPLPAGHPVDRSKIIQLGAFGFTVNIIVDVMVF